MTSIKIDGTYSAVNSLAPLACEPARIYRLPGTDTRVSTIAGEAERWLTFARERSRMSERVLVSKALTSVAFSVQHGARSYALPSKLSGTRAHQRTLWALVRECPRPWMRLTLDTVSTDGVNVSLDEEPLGAIQPKHVPWLRPLVPFGVAVYLARVTGSESDRFTLGVNIVIAGTGEAITRLGEALGTGQSHGGDGHAGDGLPTLTPGMSLVQRPAVPCLPSETLPEPLDVVLYRTVGGQAIATAQHVVRHSPSGFEWGYAGSGPADLALSILARVAGIDEADCRYHDFLHEVVAHLPHAGGLVRAVDVRSWLAHQTAPRPAA